MQRLDTVELMDVKQDSENEHIYHSELFIMTRKMVAEGNQILSFTIPIFEPLPSQYYIRAVSDTWLSAEALLTVSFQHLILPEVRTIIIFFST